MAELTGKCIACGKRFTITPALMQEAKKADCAISPCCNFPSIIIPIAFPPRHKAHQGGSNNKAFDSPFGHGTADPSPTPVGSCRINRSYK